ncbi:MULTISPECIES: hypothetical protein [Neisseria]|jgi:hypothetical protein|uniref:Uncharacterized protein n=1 Tax=Neisseria subflava NJ9703 TaxID=546268 RepID=A0A9W5IP46_NEISU|nr:MULTISPECIES: hypothetical protein [Neisseria]EFC51078.1 hypothetical protein NEISUBOT_05508 [Neisseria subflava NJ9703]OFN18363.1 hypothetical protein HMPREF2601_02230 [Neisseria sp. HMSC072B12]
MSKQNITYSQIDFVVKAPRFRIVFSYMSDKGVAFVREYLLRLLKVTPCKPAQIAQYFGFNQYETEVALADLESNKWIIWQDNGLIALSADGQRLFQDIQDSPHIPTLKEYGGEYRMELLDSNFLKKNDCDKNRQQAIELVVEPKVLSESSEIARKTFQNRFRQLIEDDIIKLDEKDISLYKIDAIEPKGVPDYFRFTQQFELLPETGEAKERHDVPTVTHQENIQQAITAQLERFGHHDNLRELRNSMAEISDDDTLKVLFGGTLDFNEYLKVYQKHEQQNGLYFLGQIYHQETLFQQINKILDELSKKSSKKLYWLAPSDIYWGKQRKIHGKIQNLIDKQKNGYDFRLYLPLPSERNRHEKQEWLNHFKDISDKVLYGFCEGFLDGNTEILFLEDQFAVVCYHAKLSSYPVTLPIGFMTTNIRQVNHIISLAKNYLSSPLFPNKNEDEIGQKDFGLLKS